MLLPGGGYKMTPNYQWEVFDHNTFILLHLKSILRSYDGTSANLGALRGRKCVKKLDKVYSEVYGGVPPVVGAGGAYY